MLGHLSQKHTLFLISRKEAGRREIFEQLGIKVFFSQVFFVDSKNRKIFKELLGDSQGVVVGDSITDEIAIGNDLGYTTIRIQQGAFAHQIPRSSKETPTYTIFNLSELETILKKYEE